MAGIRNAPDVTTTPTYKRVSFHFVDDSNDVHSESLNVDVASTRAELEALADALVPASGASLYWIEETFGWGSIRSKSSANAEAADTKSASVFDGINIVHANANPLISNQTLRVVAPMGSLFVLDAEDVPQDVIDPSSALLLAIQTASEAILPAGYQAIYAQYSERQELNAPPVSLTALA